MTNSVDLDNLIQIKERFELLMKATQDAIWDWDLRTNELWWNPSFYNMFGYAPSELKPRFEEWSKRIHPEQRDKVVHNIKSAIKECKIRWEHEYRFKRADGSFALVLDRGYLHFDDNGTAIRMVGSMIDITNQKKAIKDLQESQSRLNAIFDSVLDGIAVFDMEQNLILLNPAQAEINGYQSVEDMKKHLSYFATVYELYYLNGKLCPIHEWPISRVYRGDAFTDYLLIGKRTDTKQEWLFNFSGSPVRDSSSKITMAVVVTKDITEQEKNISELRKQYRLTEIITSNATTGLLIMDDNQRCSFMNEAAEKITGYSFKEIRLLDKPLHDIIHHTRPDGKPYPINECPIDRALPSKRNSSGTDVFVRPDGSFYDVSYNASPLIENNQPIGTVIEIRDITEEKQRIEDIKNQEEQFHVFANNIQNLAWMAKPDGHIYWYNKQWYDYTGTTLDEMQGWGWQKVHHPDHVNRVRDFVKEAWKKGEPFEITFPLRASKGEFRRFLTRVFPVKSEDGTLLSWIGTNTDIEQERAFAERLEREVTERTLALKESNDSLQRFAHIASHDLKEPVRKIKLFGELLTGEFKSALPERGQMYLQKMLEGSYRINSMIDGILEFASIDSFNQRVEVVDLNNTIGTIENDLEHVIKEKAATINIEGKLPSIEGWPLLLHQLFFNLISNALKFSTKKPVLQIRSEILNDDGINYAKISLRDNGIGFDQQYADSIFNTFTRLNAKSDFEGTGLGLSLCRKVVERHNGSIEANGKVNNGAEFIITLPFKQPRKSDLPIGN